MNLVTNVLDYCKENNISQAKFAVLSGVNKSTLNKGMNGSRPFTPKNVLKIETALKAKKGKKNGI